MGWLNRLFFAKKSVAKHQKDKAVESIKETSEDLSDKAGEMWDDAKENASKIGDKLVEQTGDTWNKVKKTGSEVYEKAKDKYEDLLDGDAKGKINEGAAKAGDKITESLNKAGDKAADLGEKVIATSDKIIDKSMDVAENLTKKAKAAGDKIKDKAQHVLDNPEESVDAFGRKAQEAIDKVKDEFTTSPEDFADTPLTESKLHESTLDGTDDFFERAADYADGDHQAFKDEPQIKGKIEKAAEDINLRGFTDGDGDGDDLIDDAEIVES